MDHEKTLELLAKALEIAPGDWETRSHMAALCIELGRAEQAADLIANAPALPDDGPGRLNAAELFARAGAGSPALRIIDLLLAENKANAKAHLLKANIYRERGMRPEARKHYNVAAVIDESLEDAEFESWLDGRELTAPAVSEAQPGSNPPSTALLRSPLDDLPLTPGDGGFGIGPTFDDGDSGGDHDHYGRPSDGDDYDEFDEFDGAFSSGMPFGADGDFLLSNPLPTINFSEVGGMEDIKERVRMKIIYPFKNKGVFAKYRKKAGGGLLLYGPPGCGKTLIARATAGECGAYFNAISIPEILSKWFGESEARLHSLFEAARHNAPAILFIDELDALGVKRTEAMGAMGSLVNVLLTEIDGASSDNEDVLVLGATNSPWRIDPAFRRPGRFDHTIFVPPPDAEARSSILELLLDGIPAEEVDLAKLVNATERFSGADLRAVVDGAIEQAIADEMRTGNDSKITGKMLLSVAEGTRSSTLEWLEQAANYASYANQSGIYDELAKYLREG